MSRMGYKMSLGISCLKSNIFLQETISLEVEEAEGGLGREESRRSSSRKHHF